jgi:hypothetical protein
VSGSPRGLYISELGWLPSSDRLAYRVSGNCSAGLFSALISCPTIDCFSLLRPSKSELILRGLGRPFFISARGILFAIFRTARRVAPCPTRPWRLSDAAGFFFVLPAFSMLIRRRLANNQRACYLSPLRVRTLAGHFLALGPTSDQRCLPVSRTARWPGPLSLIARQPAWAQFQGGGKLAGCVAWRHSA